MEFRKLVLLTLATILSGTTAHSAGLELSRHKIERADGSEIDYYVGRRGSRERQPVLVVMQGSDCRSILEHSTIEEYTEIAPNHAVLFVETYGVSGGITRTGGDDQVDCPDSYLRHNSLERRILDYVRVLAELRRNSPWWDGTLIILAGSAGTYVAERVAVLVPETDRLVIFGFGARKLESDVLFSIKASFDAGGLQPEKRDQQLAEVKKMFQEIVNNPTPNKNASGHSFKWWASMLEFDQLVALQDVQVPVLAIQGARDQNVSPDGARMLIRELQARGRTNVSYREYEDLDHGFVDSEGRSQKRRVISDIRQWLERNL
ncbi:MAG: prolyl oligopeptidase family serine peptidase [Anderseniella sp.]